MHTHNTESSTPLGGHTMNSDEGQVPWLECHWTCVQVTNPWEMTPPYLCVAEEPDQAVEVVWCVDAMMNKTIGMFQVQPMCKYSLEIPSQQETVVLKFEAFGQSKFQLPI